MRRLYAIGAAAAAFTLGAAAQDAGPELQLKQQLERIAAGSKMLYIRGGVMGPTVKGAPFSGEEIDEVTQVLGDGTRIHRENRDSVYRDSEGRMRRETGDTATIWDPVAGASYLLDNKAQTATKMPLAENVVWFNTNGSGGGKRVQYLFRTQGPVGERQMAELKARIGGVQGVETAAAKKPAVERESLGSKTIEGLACDGTRETSTIEAGSIGNDRPIQIVDERWYSPALQRTVMTRHSDPRTGEETSRLTNVRRGDPPPDLFQVPAYFKLLSGPPPLRP